MSWIFNGSVDFTRGNSVHQPFADRLDTRQFLEPEIALPPNSDTNFIGGLEHTQTGLIKQILVASCRQAMRAGFMQKRTS